MKSKLVIPAAFALVTAANCPAALVISEIDLANNQVEIVNTGTSEATLAGYFVCNRFNGSPFYIGLNTSQIVAAASDTATLVLGANEVVTFQFTASYIPDASGELGLYRNNSGFGNAANIVDYVAWGANATRDSVAATAGIWTNATFIDVSGLQAGQTLQLGEGLEGNGLGDYSLAPSTIGTNQLIPEPSALILGGLGVAGVVLRRKRA